MRVELRSRSARQAVLVVAIVVTVGACSGDGYSGASPVGASSPAVAASAVPAATASAEDEYQRGAGRSDYGTGGYGAATPSAEGSETGEAEEEHEVAVATDSKLGKYLVGAGGRTLYAFMNDEPGKSNCSAGCASSWPPFTVAAGEQPVAGDGVTGELGTIDRGDGTLQVTYKGAPLYYFGGDAKAGDTNGQGVGGVWFVAKP